MKKIKESLKQGSLKVQTKVNFEIIEKELDEKIAIFITDNLLQKKQYTLVTSTFKFKTFLAEKTLIIQAIRIGIPYSLFDTIQYYAPFNELEWAKFLDISTKSLQRYKHSSSVFKPIQSEKIIEIAEVTSAGLDVFGDMDKFKLWLYTPSFALGNIKPIELLNDSYGKELVLSELVRINHGILV
jgi:putative toxin-antitoxin system antitoxin component (TIGR02293 family)